MLPPRTKLLLTTFHQLHCERHAVQAVILAIISFLVCIYLYAEQAKDSSSAGARTPAEQIAETIKSLIDEKVPLYEQAPFDLIILDAANNHAVLKVAPLALPDRKLPQPLPKTGYLDLELFDEPGERYRLPWRNIVEIRLFERLLIEKATQLIREKRFGEAYDYLDHLSQFYPKAEGLSEVQQLFLYEEAMDALASKTFDRAYANLINLYRLNPQYPALADHLSQAAEGLILRYLEIADYASARGVVDSLAQLTPQHPLVQRWRKVWQEQAEDLRTQIEAALAAGQPRQADRLLRQLRQIWPALTGLPELSNRVQEAYPRLRVAVTLPAISFDPNSLTDWAARRSGRLVYRSLLEYVAPGGEGGVYQSQIIDWKIEELGRRLVFQLRPDRPPFHASGSVYTTYDLAHQLLAMVDPVDQNFTSEWSVLLNRVRMVSPDVVIVELRHAHVRPEGLLRWIPTPGWNLTGTGEALTPENGPFTRSKEESDDKTAVYLRTHSGQQAPGLLEIEEIAFSRGRDAIRALKQGNVDMIDRVNPWELHLLENDASISIASYRVPLVHMLVPNFSRPLPANRDFRRAMLYAIDRPRILKAILNQRNLPGCQVVSGPLPVGRRFDDPLGHGYDTQIAPRPYQPSLALALADLAYRQTVEIAKNRGLPVPARKKLILVHPPHEIAREACSQIKRQWQLIGWETTLVELHPGSPDLPSDFDFLYVEAAVWDPITDLARCFALIRRSQFFPTQVDAALSQLGQAVDWPDASSRLKTLHRRIYEDTTVLPLWQLTDYYAFRKGIQGIETERATLYQNVELWTLSDSGR